MLFSCKISNSIITYLDRKGEDYLRLVDVAELPLEFLRDPSQWIPADKMESFLEKVNDRIEGPDFDLSFEAGKGSFELRSWGVLDSVLKLMESPEDIFNQPGRFLSYFISPQPPVMGLKQVNELFYFQVPITDEQYPFVTSFLTGALEGLPLYMGKTSAKVLWKNSEVEIKWSDKQESLLKGEEQQVRQLDPQLVQSMMESLELEQRHRSTSEIASLISQPAINGVNIQYQQVPLPENWREEIKDLKNQFYRIYDYFIRSQQLVTLLVGQGRADRQVKQAMQRVDWELVQKQYGPLIETVCEKIDKISQVAVMIETSNQMQEQKVPLDLNDVVQSTIEEWKNKSGSEVRVDTHLLMDRKVDVYPGEIETMLEEIFNLSSERLDGGGYLRVVARPKGKKAEIEISDTGKALENSEMESIFESPENESQSLNKTKKIINKHNGNISVSSRPGQGSTYLVELPL